VTSLPQHRRVKRGLARTYQINTLFPGLTVLESVVLAVLERKGLAARWMRPVASYREENEEARTLLATLKLEPHAATRTAELPYGHQRLVEIALALATRPSILLLDEPAAGIPSAESVEVLGVIAALPTEVTILFIEHDMGLVFRFAERITVLVGGSVLTEGSPEEIASDAARMKQIYGTIPMIGNFSDHHGSSRPTVVTQHFPSTQLPKYPYGAPMHCICTCI